MNLRRIIVVTGLLILTSCVSSRKGFKKLSIDELNLFLQIASNTEFGDQVEGIKKWNSKLSIYLNNPEHKELVKEFEIIAAELNSLSSSISINRVTDISTANFVIFFSDKKTYQNYEPAFKKYKNGTRGFFWTYMDPKDFTIYKGSMYVNAGENIGITCQKHVLREELTQALGLMHDHNFESTSIFHNGQNCPIKYSKTDKKIIKTFLSPNIKSGMSSQQVRKLLTD